MAFLASGNPAPPALAHGGRVPLAEWGHFAPETARCQRALLAATLRCSRQTWATRRRCGARELAGDTCDTAATDARVVAIRRAALDLADHYCNERRLGELGFLGQFDMQTDIIGACRAWEDLMESATYATAAASDATCIRTADRVLTRATTRHFDHWNRALRRIATVEMSPERKEALVAREEQRRDALEQRVRESLAPACGVPEAERLTRVIELAVCPPASISVQERVVCPPPICDNGLDESPACED